MIQFVFNWKLWIIFYDTFYIKYFISIRNCTYVTKTSISLKIIISTSKIHRYSCNNNYIEIVRDRSSIIIISRQNDFVVGQTRRRIESTSIKNNTLAGIYNYQKRKHFTAPIIPDAFNHPAETSPVGQTINMENQRRSYTIFLAIIKSTIHRYRKSIPYIYWIGN